uniref:Uncharacterized protein n=1 Tax=Erpetoichthys calabaricus TaxID=27687 RepID=A0A8C4SGH7_ERPCA
QLAQGTRQETNSGQESLRLNGLPRSFLKRYYDGSFDGFVGLMGRRNAGEYRKRQPSLGSIGGRAAYALSEEGRAVPGRRVKTTTTALVSVAGRHVRMCFGRRRVIKK